MARTKQTARTSRGRSATLRGSARKASSCMKRYNACKRAMKGARGLKLCNQRLSGCMSGAR